MFSAWSNLILDLASRSDVEAREAANDLQQHIEEEVEQDSEMGKRLMNLEIPDGALDDLDHFEDNGLDTESHDDRCPWESPKYLPQGIPKPPTTIDNKGTKTGSGKSIRRCRTFLQHCSCVFEGL